MNEVLSALATLTFIVLAGVDFRFLGVVIDLPNGVLTS